MASSCFCCRAILVALLVALYSGKLPAGPSQEEKKEARGLPLQATDKIEFTTDEGTWLSLDVSPDGETIVFDLLGDLYTLPIGGGEARRIIAGMSFESQPRFSPDGRAIVFISDRDGAENVWISDPAGNNLKQVSKGRNQMFASPAWTPDGKWIVVSRSVDSLREYSLRIYDREGGSGVPVGSEPPAEEPRPEGGRPQRPNLMGAAVSPDGKYIYYSKRLGLFNYNAMFPIWQIERFDRSTSEVSTLTNAQGSAMRPLLSPDGRHLVYATRRETKTGLRVRDLETGAERWLSYPVTRDDQESRATRDTMPGYAFLPDGQSLVIHIDGKIQRVDFSTGKATVIPFTARVEAEIGPRLYFQYRVDDSPTVTARLIRWPALSPDNRDLAFSSLNKIWIMALPAGEPRRLTPSTLGEFMPSWSPDGRFVTYVTWSADGGHIWRIPAGGGEPEQLTRRPAYYSEPVYTPDGSKIVFVSGRKDAKLYSDLQQHSILGEITGIAPTEGLELRWIPAEGGDSVLIGPAQGGSGLHFAGSSERVYWTTRSGLTSVRLDGFERKVHVSITGSAPGPNPPGADEIRISPDGSQVFISLENRHYLAPLPRAGKETIKLSIKPEGPAAVAFRKISKEGGDFLAWSADGRWLTWSLGATFYRQGVAAESPEAVPVKIDQPRFKPRGSVVLSGARIISMKGDEIVENGDLVVTGNRIAALGSKGKVAIPEGARIIDLKDKTIIPGFVDVHAHMWPPRGVHQTQVWQYLANLAFGITTTRDPQSSTTDIFAYADLVETGDILGPRIYTTGPGVFSRSGLDSLEATRDFVKRYKEAYHSDTLKQYMSGDRIVRQWVAMACREFGLTPTTEGALDMKLDLSQMADGFSGNEHALPLQPLYKDVVQFVARTKTFYTPTMLVAYGAPWAENYYYENTDMHSNRKLRRFIPGELLDSMVRRRPQWFLPEEYAFQGIAKGVADVVHAGGRACLGGHGQLQGLGHHWEIWLMQSGGLTPHEALRTATIFPAEAIGLQQDLGSLEAGKLADLVVLEQNPLTDIRNTASIRLVMKNGELFEGDTLDRIWPSERKLEKMYWWGDQPQASPVP